MSESKELEVLYNIGDNEIRLTPSIVQNYIVGNDSKITLPEFKFFTELCRARKLNPFLKEAYCIKYGNQPAQIVVGKDVFLKRADAHPQYDGKESGVIIQKEDGTIEERIGCFVAPKETLLGGWAKVYRKDRKYPSYMSVSFEEAAGRKGNGELNSSWKKQGATMIEKVAKVRALREAFIEEFQGMYVEEELENSEPQQDSAIKNPFPDAIEVEVKDANEQQLPRTDGE
jgi:phage recombination protein Bet